MTTRQTSLISALMRLLRFTSLALLPALTTEVLQANPVSRDLLSRDPIDGPGATSHRSRQVPYLTAVLPVPLRFEDLPAPPASDLEPVPTGPAMPDDSTLPSIPPSPTIKEKPGVIPQQPQQTASQPTTPDATTANPQKPVTAKSSQPAQQPDQELTPILPDDMRHDVRPEDVIPFFQFPKAGVIINTPVPQQPPQPGQIPSSATYSEQ